MLIYVVRHGQTDHNVAGIIQGQLDTPLNDHGRHEASLVADWLARERFQEIWSSSLSRASETADIIARSQVKAHSGEILVQTHLGLMERGLGALEGRRRHAGEALPSDVESSDTFRKRIAAWFTGFLASHRDTDSDGSICVVSHGAYITTFVALLLSSHYFHFERADNVDMRAGCHNTSIMKVECRYQPDRGRWEGKVLSFGNVDHIAKEARSHGHASRLADDLKG